MVHEPHHAMSFKKKTNQMICYAPNNKGSSIGEKSDQSSIYTFNTNNKFKKQMSRKSTKQSNLLQEGLKAIQEKQKEEKVITIINEDGKEKKPEVLKEQQVDDEIDQRSSMSDSSNNSLSFSRGSNLSKGEIMWDIINETEDT